MNRILCVANYRASVGYAWWLMETFWAAIAEKYPGRVIVAFPQVDCHPQKLIDAGAEIDEYDFRVNATKYVRKKGIAHVYLTDRPYFSLHYWRLRQAGVRSIIIHDHTPGDRSTNLPKRFVKRCLTRLPCAADAYIAVSDIVLQRFLDCIAIPASKCHLARNGIPLNIDIAPTNIREELGLPPDAIVVVSSGRAVQYKGVQHIIEAASLLERDDVFFVHCGDGPDLSKFQEHINRLGLQTKFFLLGKRGDVPGILASADIAVHASEGEALSLAILEFMRAGLPILVPNNPTVCQTVDHGKNGLIYDGASAANLATSINSLANNEELRRTLGSKGRLDVYNYDIRKTVEAVLNVFDHLRIT